MEGSHGLFPREHQCPIRYTVCTVIRATGALMVRTAGFLRPFHNLTACLAADEFDPDRFLDERLHKYLTPNPFIFLPFNAGPRICLGQQFAYNEMSFFLVRLVQSFEAIHLDMDSQEPVHRVREDWAACPGRKGKEKVWPKSHLTVYVAVSAYST